MHLNDLHRHLDTLAGTPQSVPTWRSLVEALKSQQLLSILVHSSDQDKIDIAIKLYDIIDAHDLGLQEAFFGVDHIKSIIENETITAVGNKIELYLKRHALPTEDTTTGTPKPSRKERWTNRRNRNKKDDEEMLPANTEPKKSRRERLEEAVAPVVEERRKTFGKQQEAEPPLFTIDLDEDDTSTPNTTKGPSRRTTFREKKAAQCAALKDAVNNGLDGLKTRKNNLVDAAKKNFNEFGQKSKKALDTFRNGPDFDDFTMEEQGQIGLLGDYAKDFLEDPAHAGQNLTDLILCDYAKSQRHISYKKAYKYLLTLQKADILTISRWRGIIEMAGVTRPQKAVPDMNTSLENIESYLITRLSKRQAPSFKELWTWFVEERFGADAKRPNDYVDDDKLFLTALLDKLIQEGFIITRGRGDKTTYHKGPKFRTHTVAPAQTSHASDNEALDVVYAQMDSKTLQLETRVYTEVLQVLKKILENDIKSPKLGATQLTLLTDAIQLYETQADQLNQINPYTLLALFDEIDAPIPPLLWEWKNTLEKTYIDHIRQEEVIKQQPRIKAHLLSQFTSDSLRDKLATKYIVVAYEEDDIPASLKSMFISQVLSYFRECAGALGTTRQYDERDITAFIGQCMEQDIARELAREGVYMPDTTTTIDQGIVTQSGGMHRFQSAELFAQALTLKKNASEQEEFIDELAYPDMHLAHLQKRPPTTKIDHGTGWKGIKGKFSTAVSNAFADDTPTAKAKTYTDQLSEKYLAHCTPHLYTRTIKRNETIQIDQETGTITYTLDGQQTSCIVDRKTPEEAMSKIAMESSNSRNDEEKAKIIKALLKSYAENLVDADGPQKFINKAGEPCIISIEADGKIVLYINGNKRSEPFVNGSETSYQNLLVFRSYISSAMEQFIPLDQRLHAERKTATGSVSLPSRSAERNAFNRGQRLSTSELPITTGKIITTPASTRKVRDSSVEGGYREEAVTAKSRDANMILIPAGDELLDKSNAGQHIFTLPGNLTTFWKERTFIRFAEKVIEVKYIDTLANQKRYEVIAEWDSREKVYDNVDMHALLNKEIERMGNDQAIAHMQPLVSFIIPEQHGTDAAQVYYFNPETQERFKGEDKDGHPGVSDRDLGDFATDIRSGNVLERGPELKVRVQAFATDKKGRMNRSRFERERITKRPHTLKMRKLEDTQIPRVLKESLHAKKAINDALAACLARLS